jgi:3-oxoacyl-(acyl-carrier-protein) synthase
VSRGGQQVHAAKKFTPWRFLHIAASNAASASGTQAVHRGRRLARTNDAAIRVTGNVDEISRENQERLEVSGAGACDVQTTSFFMRLS